MTTMAIDLRVLCLAAGVASCSAPAWAQTTKPPKAGKAPPSAVGEQVRPAAEGRFAVSGAKEQSGAEDPSANAPAEPVGQGEAAAAGGEGSDQVPRPEDRPAHEVTAPAEVNEQLAQELRKQEDGGNDKGQGVSKIAVAALVLGLVLLAAVALLGWRLADVQTSLDEQKQQRNRLSADVHDVKARLHVRTPSSQEPPQGGQKRTWREAAFRPDVENPELRRRIDALERTVGAARSETERAQADAREAAAEVDALRRQLGPLDLDAFRSAVRKAAPTRGQVLANGLDRSPELKRALEAWTALRIQMSSLSGQLAPGLEPLARLASEVGRGDSEQVAVPTPASTGGAIADIGRHVEALADQLLRRERMSSDPALDAALAVRLDGTALLRLGQELCPLIRTAEQSQLLQTLLNAVSAGPSVEVPKPGSRYDSKTMEIARTWSDSSEPSGTVLRVRQVALLAGGEVIAGCRAQVETAP